MNQNHASGVIFSNVTDICRTRAKCFTPFFLPSRAKAKGKADLASGTITDSLILEFHIQI